MSGYSEQIVYTPSEDQRWLAGLLIQPGKDSRRRVGVVCIHGSVEPFYFPPYVLMGRELARRGYLFVSGHTRGHDLLSVDAPWPLSARPQDIPTLRLGGWGWERWTEDEHDVAGWINFLVGQGVELVVLLGHSSGVGRVTYYQARRQDPRVVGMVLASSSDRVQPQDPARVALAERLVAEGQGDTPLPLIEGRPIFFAIESAANVVHWERDVAPLVVDGHMPWIAQIRTPVLATLGTAELETNLRTAVEEMQRRAVQAPRFNIQEIEGADHAYTGRERELADVVARWLDTLPMTRTAAPRRWWGGRTRTR